MCSILGVFDLRPGADLQPLRPLALSLSARQRHRGPDWSGVHADANALLVHERLAIVDPAGGAQALLLGHGQHRRLGGSQSHGTALAGAHVGRAERRDVGFSSHQACAAGIRHRGLAHQGHDGALAGLHAG